MRPFKWFTTQRLALVAIISVTGLAVASTKMVDLIIQRSTIDSSPIGLTTPAQGVFTQLRTVNAVSNPTSTNTSNMGWNAQGQGETDFVNNHGTGGPNAFAWFTASNTAPNYNIGAPIMWLIQNGALSTAASVNSPLIQASSQVNGPIGSFGIFTAGSSNTGAGSAPQGLYGMWNLSGGSGESDFVNNRGAGIGGFRWYLGGNGNMPGSLVMALNSDGSLSNGNGFHGNADSATQLNHTPANCGGTIGATGIQQNGDANCNSWPQSAATTGWTTLPGGIIMEWGQSGTFDTGPVSLTLAHTLPNGCLHATVSDLFVSASRIASLVSCSSSSITVRNNGSGQVSYTVIGH